MFIYRVFILLVALGQKSLTGASSACVLESLLTMLAKLLAPLMTFQIPARHAFPQSKCTSILPLKNYHLLHKMNYYLNSHNL